MHDSDFIKQFAKVYKDRPSIYRWYTVKSDQLQELRFRVYYNTGYYRYEN